MNMTDDSNQIRPNIFAFDHTAPNIEWTRITAGPGTFVNNIYNGYPTQSNVNIPSTSFPFYSTIANPYNNVNPFTCTTNTVNTPMAPSYTANVTSPIQRMAGLNDFRGITTHAPFRCKRKTDSPPPIATKQHITEEKMALHMSQLHISSETAPSISKLEQEPSENRQKRLYMCEEMRKLQTESILPQSILNRMQRPCTALVLWQPPQRPFPLPNTEPVDEDNNNNNNDIVTNNNNNNSLNNNIEEIEVEIEDEMDLEMR